MHFDSAREIDGRVITAILYLNEGWHAEHGGELRLLPCPFEHVDVAPLFNRLCVRPSRPRLSM